MKPVLGLRAHHLLCAGEFRGLGYSQEFVANFARILADLASHPERPVRLIVDGPDAVCAVCPWLKGGACSRDEGGKKGVSHRDEIVCARLGLKPGAVISFGDLAALFRSRVPRAWRVSVCRGCSWFGSPCYGEEESARQGTEDSFTPACRDRVQTRSFSEQRAAEYYPVFFPVHRR
ncbi:MAG: DUF1284 domain-containing protein [Firmicutes bacterium]|nr:DUF1284 domain-containing protein [Bacillota bacterium]